MALTCPQCGEPIPWERRLFRAFLWARWPCRRCGAVLRFKATTRIVAGLVSCLVIAFGFGSLYVSRANKYLVVTTMVLIGAAFSWAMIFLEQVAIVQWGFGHCQGCGYDLTGLTSDRCPECGRPIHQGST